MSTISKSDIDKFYRISLFGKESDPVTAAVKRAYRDFCRTINFEKKTDHSKAIERVVSVFHLWLTKISGIQSTEGYDRWHEGLYNKIKDAFDDAPLTVGQIQKWINMTMKYLIILERKTVENIEPFLHVPIDSIILKKSKKSKFFKDDETNKIQSWSRIDNYTRYKDFQKEIRKEHNEPPIRWEFEAWNEAGEKLATSKKKENFEKYNYYQGEALNPFDPDSVSGMFWHGEMMYDRLRDKDFFTQEARVWRKTLEEQKPDCSLLQYGDVTLGIILYTDCLFGKFCPYGRSEWIFEYKIKQRTEKPAFYKKLSSHGKKHYDEREKRLSHTPRFVELMNQTQKSAGAAKGMFFTLEEIEYLGKEDLVTLRDRHPSDADFYMLCD